MYAESIQFNAQQRVAFNLLILAKKKQYVLLAPTRIHITTFANINDFVLGVSDVMGLTENISYFPKVLQKQWRNSMEHTHTKKMNISTSQKRL